MRGGGGGECVGMRERVRERVIKLVHLFHMPHVQ